MCQIVNTNHCVSKKKKTGNMINKACKRSVDQREADAECGAVEAEEEDVVADEPTDTELKAGARRVLRQLGEDEVKENQMRHLHYRKPPEWSRPLGGGPAHQG